MSVHACLVHAPGQVREDALHIYHVLSQRAWGSAPQGVGLGPVSLTLGGMTAFGNISGAGASSMLAAFNAVAASGESSQAFLLNSGGSQPAAAPTLKPLQAQDSAGLGQSGTLAQALGLNNQSASPQMSPQHPAATAGGGAGEGAAGEGGTPGAPMFVVLGSLQDSYQLHQLQLSEQLARWVALDWGCFGAAACVLFHACCFRRAT